MCSSSVDTSALSLAWMKRTLVESLGVLGSLWQMEMIVLHQNFHEAEFRRSFLANRLFPKSKKRSAKA
jgi:hypothetical protein